MKMVKEMKATINIESMRLLTTFYPDNTSAVVILDALKSTAIFRTRYSKNDRDIFQIV